MDDDHQHEKVTTVTPQPDGSDKIETRSYYEKLANIQEELEKQIPVDRRNVLKEIINCLEFITRDGSPELTIRIKARGGEPVLLTRRHVTYRQNLGKK